MSDNVRGRWCEHNTREQDGQSIGKCGSRFERTLHERGGVRSSTVGESHAARSGEKIWWQRRALASTGVGTDSSHLVLHLDLTVVFCGGEQALLVEVAGMVAWTAAAS